MLTIVEKVIFLQNIDVFAQVPSEQLAYVAAIAEEVTMAEGEAVYAEGDPADALYLVLDGSVRLHRGEHEILVAGPRQAFGSWALFEETPRVVTATVQSETTMLRIYREDFVDLLADHVQMTQSILSTIVSRLRSLVDRVGIERTHGDTSANE